MSAVCSLASTLTPLGLIGTVQNTPFSAIPGLKSWICVSSVVHVPCASLGNHQVADLISEIT